jgi:hypothetical protein
LYYLQKKGYKNNPSLLKKHNQPLPSYQEEGTPPPCVTISYGTMAKGGSMP